MTCSSNISVIVTCYQLSSRVRMNLILVEKVSGYYTHWLQKCVSQAHQQWGKKTKIKTQKNESPT